MHRADDASLRLEVDGRRGLRRGSYLLRFGYTTHSLRRSMRWMQGQDVVLRWVGPRFDSGIDLAKVIFRLPRAAREPRLILPGEEGQLDSPGGGSGALTVVATARRGAQYDELELVRPYVARGEPVVWSVTASAEAFDVQRSEPPRLRPTPSAHPKPEMGLSVVWFAPLVSLLFGAIVWGKHRGVQRFCWSQGARVASLVPCSPRVLAVLAGTALGASTIAGLYLTSWPCLTILAILAMALAAHRAPRSQPMPRGPGRWLPLTADEAFWKVIPNGQGAWLDAGRWRGRVVFLLSVGGLAAWGWSLWQVSPQSALTVCVVSSALLPVFLTGRQSQMPPDPATSPRPLLGWLFRRLVRDSSLRVVPWARIPDRIAEPDELRLRIFPSQPVEGLISIEVACEYEFGPGGRVEVPCILVRATEGSPCMAALAPAAVWTRGRQANERVTVLRVTLPVRGLVMRLVRRVVDRLSEPLHAQDGSSRSSISRGRSAYTAKAPTVPSPAQAM